MHHLKIKASILISIIFKLVLLTTINSYAAEEPKVLYWDELIPKDWNPNSVFEKFTDEEFREMSTEQYFELQETAQKMLDAAPIVDSLDGQTVSIPGFLVPLEFDKETIKEFLLVPYFGACTHSPPPPANQVIHGKLQSELTISELYDPVWITGKIQTLRSQSKLGETGIAQTIDVNTGYTMEVYEVTPYQEDN